MLRLYKNNVNPEYYETEDGMKLFQQDMEYFKKMVYCLCWFHSIIIERKRFKSLGWNVPYDFNDSDFGICKDIIASYIKNVQFDDKEKDKGQGRSSLIQWDAIRYLIGEANYGGRVTDKYDAKLLGVYTNEFFTQLVLTEEKFFLAGEGLPEYYVPDDAA